MAKKKRQCVCSDYLFQKLAKEVSVILSDPQDKKCRHSVERKSLAKVVTDEGKTQANHRDREKGGAS